jgi:hypothetical protein
LLLVWGVSQIKDKGPTKAELGKFNSLMTQADSTFREGRKTRDLRTVEGAGYLYKEALQVKESPLAEKRSERVNRWIMAYNDSLKKLAAAPGPQPDDSEQEDNTQDAIALLREQGYKRTSDWLEGVAIFARDARRGSGKEMLLANRQGQALSKVYDKLEELANGYLVFHKNKQRGYLNLEGKEVIAARFDAAWPFGPDGQAMVKEGGRTFYIDASGSCVRDCEKKVVVDPKELPIPKMKGVAGGTFLMGDGGTQDNEKPAHKVKLSSFEIGVYEVTQREWQAVMGSNPSSFKCPDCPVETVSWEDVQKYIRKLNQLTGSNFRLPTEAEWEYAARGGNSQDPYTYAGSNSLSSYGWYDHNSGSKTHPVGQKRPNGLGLYDMSGNVWEWCSDWYDSDYYSTCKSQGTVSNPSGPKSGS